MTRPLPAPRSMAMCLDVFIFYYCRVYLSFICVHLCPSVVQKLLKGNHRWIVINTDVSRSSFIFFDTVFSMISFDVFIFFYYPCASVFICGSKAFKRKPPMDCDKHRCEQKLIFNFRTVLLWFPLMCLSFLKIYPCASVFIRGSTAFVFLKVETTDGL